MQDQRITLQCEVEGCEMAAEACECGCSHCEDHPHESDVAKCAFCGHAGATDVYREEDYPDAPCCADEDACHARVLAS